MRMKIQNKIYFLNNKFYYYYYNYKNLNKTVSFYNNNISFVLNKILLN